ncbi:MAG: ACT domain-containing protein, partial [Oscillospiraceae bacterium]
SISFTVSDTQVALVLEIANNVIKKAPEIKTLVSSGNVKISLYGEEMPSKFGVAADVFNNLAKKDIDIMLITTSDVDISVLVSGANGDCAYQTLVAAYL